MDKFRIPKIPISVNKSVRFPVTMVDEVEEAIRGQDCTFSAFVVSAVRWALDAGYRHIDTAAVYRNEASVGRAIEDSGIPRDQIWITTKLWNDEIRAENEEAAFAASLEGLRTDYVDLYLVHWPVRENDGYLRVWEKMEKFNKEGRARSIGVSNFKVRHLTRLIEQADIVPMVNQIELHPGLNQDETVSYCKEQHILVEAWGPLAQGKIFGNAEMQAIADRYGKNIAQIALRWILQRGILPLPKSVTRERIVSNAELFDFSLSPEDMKLIDRIRCEGSGSDPDTFRM